MKNRFLKNLKSYPPEQYSSGVTNAKLAAVALLKLEENDVDKTFENVVVTLQKLFPGKFSLITYPEIPDTIRVDNTLRLDAGKHSKYLTGNRPKGYKLTAIGRIAAEETIQELNSGKKSVVGLGSIQRGRYSKLVGAVIKSDAFEKFSTKQFSEINKFDICRVLQCTLETPDEKLRANMEALKTMAVALRSIKEYEKLSDDVLTFFTYVEENWEKLTND
jgi:hypothetical protein